MDPRARRLLLTVVCLAVAGGVLLSIVLSPRWSGRSKQPAPIQATNGQAPAGPPANDESAFFQQPDASNAPAAASDAGAQSATPGTDAAAAAQITSLEGLHVQIPATQGSSAGGQSLGSLDPRTHRLKLDFDANGAGISRIAFSDIWDDALAARKARKYLGSLNPGDPVDSSQLDESARTILASSRDYIVGPANQRIVIPALAVHSVHIGAQRCDLLTGSEAMWTQTHSGSFQATIVNRADAPILRMTREFSLGDGYDVTVRLTIENLTDQPIHNLRIVQYGPTEIANDPSGYIPVQRFRFGYERSTTVDPQHLSDVEPGKEFMLEYSSVAKMDGAELWPNDKSRREDYQLSWFAAHNRYLALAIHPVLDAQGRGDRTVTSMVNSILVDTNDDDANPDTPAAAFTLLYSPDMTVPAKSSTPINMGVFAGPMERHVLNKEQPYKALNMGGLIIYQISSMCAWCTFQWLAHVLLNFLALLEGYVVFDWGLAIIGLVVVVRALLHPITKRSQINMMRFSRQMAALKPEMDKLQQKYGNDRQKMQQENLRLMREHGVNPLKMLGCLPMFLQMPIWIALWAMLYLAFDIRQQPALYGVFQLFGDWTFLSDLSAQDQFAPLGVHLSIPLLGAFTSINLIPLLLGIVFFVQQKYMSPPPSAAMTPEQIQQQRIMKIMMVVMMPLFLYSAPSGLTLYILTSSCIGILESKYIRSHVDQLDLAPAKAGAAGAKGKIARDPRSRMLAEAIERAKAKRARRNEDSSRSFKKRK